MKPDLRQLASSLYKRARGSVLRPPDWQGVFPSMSAVPEQGRGFDSDYWIATTLASTRAAIETPATTNGPRCESQVLATLVAAYPSPERAVRILDFGGGMGIGYVHLKQTLAAERKVDYVVVDGKRSCEEGARLFRGRDDVQFRTVMPEAATEFDIVVACSSIQYVEDYRGLFETFVAYRPSYLLVADLPAGEVAAFWTAQLTVPGSRIAYQFLNLAELVETTGKLGYRLLMRGPQRRLRVDSLPLGNRVDRTYNLLFAR